MPPDADPLQRIAALEKRIAELEQELAVQRVQQSLMDDRLLILERNRLFRLWGQIYRAASRLYSGGELSDLRTPGDYARWVNHEQQQLAAEARQPIQGPLISVVTKDDLSTQSYPHWERVDDAAAAKGDYILLLHPGDRLSPHALYHYAQAHSQDASAELFYSDEDHLDNQGTRTDPVFKPGWSPELLRSTPYLGRSVLYRRDLFPEAKPTVRAHHIPRVLYHRSASDLRIFSLPASQAERSRQKLALIICSRQPKQVHECLAAVESTRTLDIEILVVHHLESGDGKDMRRRVEKFGGTSIPYRGTFDFARMNNLAAAQATCPYLLFMNDDVVVQQPGWDWELTAALSRPEIGVAGAVLEYPDGAIQHAGVVVGMGDAAGHCGRFQTGSKLWPWLRMDRDVTAVTGAMLAVRADLFQQMGGFDAAFPVNYNDVDLCLRMRKAGLRVVCLNLGKVIHRESQTRVAGTRYHEREALYQRWAGILSRPDEFYSRHLAPTERIALNVAEASPLQGLLYDKLSVR
jgi:GT2 family glycosyltransferase